MLERADINKKSENPHLLTIAQQMQKDGADIWEIRNNTGYILDNDGLHKETLSEFAARMEEDYTPLIIADNIKDGSAIKPYREMLLEDFNNLTDVLDAIKTAGYNRNRFINENRKQSISQAAQETAESIHKNAGAKFQEVVLDKAGFGKRILGFPAAPLIWTLRILEFFKLSPLYKWIYETACEDSFVSIDKAKNKLGWKPKFSNKDALLRNYQWYIEHQNDFKSSPGISHRVPWKQGVLKLAKMFF